MNKNAELGVNWAVWSNDDDTRIPVGTFHVAGRRRESRARWRSRSTIPAAASAGSAPGTTFGIGRIAATGVNFAAMMRAIQGDSNTNLIATPSAVTMDNQEARAQGRAGSALHHRPVHQHRQHQQR